MKLKEIIDRAKFIKHDSSTIFVCDLSDLGAEDAGKVINRSEDIVKKMPNKSVLGLAYLAKVQHSKEMEAHLQHLLDHCASHVLKAAYCNITDKKLKDAIEHVLPASGSDRRTFDSSEEGLSWLVVSEVE